MDGFLFFVLPAAVALFAAGFATRTMESLFYEAFRTERVSEYNGRSIIEIEGEYHAAQRELNDRRITRQTAEDQLDLLAKERAKLVDQERALLDKEKNHAAEIGYPTAGATGYYMKFEGPAAVMPFAGLASIPGVIGSRRQARIIVWGLPEQEAQRRAKLWAGEGATMVCCRPFTGSLLWTEAS